MTSHISASKFEAKRLASSRVSKQPAGEDRERDRGALGQQPLMRIPTVWDATGPAGAHARLLRQAGAWGSEQTRQVLRRLQRCYGNRHVQRMVGLSRTGHGEAEVAPEVEQAIGRKRGGGQALDQGVRAQMEPAMGADFSGVRVHTDGEADRLNHSLSARAFTTGKDIFFSEGAYSPGSSTGRELLAHELTHVVQQGGGVQGKLTLSQPGDIQEQEADQVAKAVMEREQQEVHRQGDGRQLQRQMGEEEEEEVQTKAEDPWVERQAEPEEEEEVPA